MRISLKSKRRCSVTSKYLKKNVWYRCHINLKIGTNVSLRCYTSSKYSQVLIVQKWTGVSFDVLNRQTNRQTHTYRQTDLKYLFILVSIWILLFELLHLWKEISFFLLIHWIRILCVQPFCKLFLNSPVSVSVSFSVSVSIAANIKFNLQI